MRKIMLVRSKALCALFRRMKDSTEELRLPEEEIKKIVEDMERSFAAISFRFGGYNWRVDDTTLPGADRIDCVCGPSRVAIRPVYSEGGAYGWQAHCTICHKEGKTAKLRNVAVLLWLQPNLKAAEELALIQA